MHMTYEEQIAQLKTRYWEAKRTSEQVVRPESQEYFRGKAEAYAIALEVIGYQGIETAV